MFPVESVGFRDFFEIAFHPARDLGWKGFESRGRGRAGRGLIAAPFGGAGGGVGKRSRSAGEILQERAAELPVIQLREGGLGIGERTPGQAQEFHDAVQPAPLRRTAHEEIRLVGQTDFGAAPRSAGVQPSVHIQRKGSGPAVRLGEDMMPLPVADGSRTAQIGHAAFEPGLNRILPSRSRPSAAVSLILRMRMASSASSVVVMNPRYPAGLPRPHGVRRDRYGLGLHEPSW